LFAAPLAIPDDTLVVVTSHAAEAPVMNSGLRGTEVPYASSEKWILHVVEKVR
jgi:hypothetical protein